MADKIAHPVPELPIADRRLRRHQRGDEFRLTAFGGLAALSLDALTSVAYGPESIVLVLVTAGAAAVSWTLPVSIAIVVLLVVLVMSYSQVIAAHPDGGGAYAVAGRDLSRGASLLAAASLVVDYVLTVAVSLAAGAASLASAFPALAHHLLAVTLIGLVALTAINLIGVAESARVLMGPTVLFVVAVLAVIVAGLAHSTPVAVIGADPGPLPPTGAVGIVLLLRAFAAGCSSLTGVEAIANAVPSFRTPAVKRAQRTEIALGALLGIMLLGLAVLIRRHHTVPRGDVTVLAQLSAAAFGTGWPFYLTNLAVTLVLVLAANTSFGGLPVLLSLLAHDNRVPHLFGMRSERPVFRYGVAALAVLAALVLVIVSADTHRLLPVFAIGVFIGFTLSQTGLVRHWLRARTRGWWWRLALNGFGAVLTAVAGVVLLVEKFTEGAWLLLLIVPALIVLFARTERYYGWVAQQLGMGTIPPHPEPAGPTLVVVPVVAVSSMTARALEMALGMGAEVHAVAADIDPASTKRLSARWKRWDPGIPLKVLPAPNRSLIATLVGYVRKQTGKGERVTVLLVQVDTPHWWQRLLHNPRGPVLAAALRTRTTALVATLTVHLDH
ncbi:APC family permease [Nocardia sp. alder85J]|uniref:APC family permease n=1 Tax=Nocardia sp. alder85J TaxID=2862949 RepID=UPI001CD24121|nr:APC family permease [Nocardia sp. alder85J]MCX4096063.1 APC family permease [Nocardia sp. alder85J]